MPPRELVVDARGVTKWFSATTALDGVDLALSAGSVHGLLGPNGAGKTTLLSVLFGLILPDEGIVRLFGRTREEAGRGWLDGVGGFVEAPCFYPYLSGRQNLEALSGLDGHDPGEAGGATIGETLELVGLGEQGQRRVRGYSLGMRQRLGLAAALIRRPRLLIVDEPGNGLDPAGLRDLRTMLRRLADDGLAVLLSSHDIAQTSEICDSVTVLRSGRIAFSGSIETMQAAAPQPAWTLRTSDDAAAVDLAVEVPNLHVVADQEGGLRLAADRDLLDAYVIRLGRAGIAVRELMQAGTPLETLFFELTEEPVTDQVLA